jgi:hypothetical protein
LIMHLIQTDPGTFATMVREALGGGGG